MKIFQTYPAEKGKHQINLALLWDYRLYNFDWQKYRKAEVERVIKMGWLADWYSASIYTAASAIPGRLPVARLWT